MTMNNAIQGTLFSRNEEVSNFTIGQFGDARLLKTGALLFKKIIHKMSTRIRQLSSNRACQVAFNRFLLNEKCTVKEIEHNLSEKTNAICLGKEHVLCLQDTVEMNYSSQRKKKEKFGINRNKKREESDISSEHGVRGFIGHPGLIVDAKNKDILGLSSVKAWTREEDDDRKPKNRRIEDKESHKWIETASLAKERIQNAEKITIIGDRESDIYELFDRVPDERAHLLIRSNYNRKLSNGDDLDEAMKTTSVKGTYEIELPAITGVRQARMATLEVKIKTIEMTAPSNIESTVQKKTIKLTCVEATETPASSGKASPVYWRILTTHAVNSLSDAQQILLWYSWRWTIEQVFRTLKKKGLNLNDSEITQPDALLKLFVLAIAAAIQVLSLVHARDGSTERPASDLFSEEEIKVLVLSLINLNGKTKKQKNPYPPNSLSWASWIIGRLGGWKGYRSERPPGPITMYHGLETFFKYVEGWKLAQKDMCTR